jgi:ubiquinone/menaquinone biosynthesis C-methylase UbiE
MFIMEQSISQKGAILMFLHLHHGKVDGAPVPQTRGFVWNWGGFYDLGAWFFAHLVLGSSERTLRQMTADLAQLQPGEAVLDVGCGTGTQAMVAKEHVGATGRVCGIDPGPQQIARARSKAARHDLAIDFQPGVIEHLAFSNASFDVVLSTLMMHHLPDDLKRQGLAEIARVLKPGGRLLILDFKGPVGPWKSRIAGLPALMEEAGFSQAEMGTTRYRRLRFAMGKISKA